MKFISLYKRLLLVFLCLVLTLPTHADELGRIFTSYEDRVRLEKIRHAKPKVAEVEVEVIEVEEIIEPVEEEKIIRDVIALKGLVHRKDGKNTAWINDSNTFEGDLESQYIEVSNENITPEDVTLIMPDDKTEIKIKVGDYFDPQDHEDN